MGKEINKITTTYNFTDEYFEGAIEKNPGYKHKKLLKWQLFIDLAMFKNLEDMGTEIAILDPKVGGNIDNLIALFEQEADNSDIIFHKSYRIGIEAVTTAEIEWKKDFINKMEFLIKTKYLDKTHFISRENYSRKDHTAEIAKKVNMPIPETWTLKDFMNMNRKYPVVLKNVSSANGTGVYLLDSEKQFRTFCNPKKYQELKERFNPNLHLPKIKNFIVQQYIETPSRHFTHYRILAVKDGSIIAAVLSVSKARKDENKIIEIDYPKKPEFNMYHHIDSPLYLSCREFRSNSSQSGRQIPLIPRNSCAKEISDEDKLILEDHGIDPECPDLPNDIKFEAQRTARTFGKKGVVYSGLDYFQDKDLKPYFIEINPQPGLKAFDTVFNRGEQNLEMAIALAIRKLSEGIYNSKVKDLTHKYNYATR
ncbi:RimK family alpha-L-glutamate ligase [Nanoarchaeota archaeon]